MMMRGSKYVWIAVALGLTALPVCGRATVIGPCSDCHTMHNSQNGEPMNYNSSGTTPGSAIPNNNLLRASNCLACHTGTNNGSNHIPYVYSTAAPTYAPATYTPVKDSAGVVTGNTVKAGTGNTLAGGNFYWVATSDGGGAGAGHNVDMLGVSAGTLTSPPGYSDTPDWATRVGEQTDMASGGHLTCAGTAGCHGDRSATTNTAAIHLAHHADDRTIDGKTVGTSFRFLLGVVGTEINNAVVPPYGWEYQPDSTHHNEYYGLARGSDTTGVTIPTLSSGTNSTIISISQLCAECHGDFHNSSGGGDAGIQGTAWGNPWIRHPTDFDMYGATSSTEYAYYTVYDPMVPLGHSTLDTGGTGTSDTTAYNATKGAIVLCISCHRAHGSPYASLLRWNYRGWPGSGGYGCDICHTTKN